MLLCIHIVGMKTFGLHGLILSVFEDYFSELLYIHIVCMEMLGLYELILYVFEDVLFG